MNRYDELSLRIIHRPSEPVLAREWLRLVRERQGLRQVDVAARLAELGPQAALTWKQVSKLENGTLSLSFLGASQAEGLRQVLNISQAEWDERLRLRPMPVREEASS